MPRDLKEPDGWRSSSLRKMRHLAERERTVDSTSGVSIQVCFVVSGACEPMVMAWYALSGAKILRVS